VYRVGPLALPLSRMMAAVLACGATAAAARRSALALWRLTPELPASVPVDVLIVGGQRRRRERGIAVYRVRELVAGERTTRDAIAVTTPARTLLDVAPLLDARQLERAVAQADRERLASAADLGDVLARNRGHRGAARLRALIGAGAAPALTRSEAESRLLALIRRAELKPPEVNVPFRGFELDFLWRAERVVVEVDGFAWHGTARAIDRDRRRELVLEAAGLHVLRVTWHQIVDAPVSTAVRIGEILAKRRLLFSGIPQ
jgi:very-short-patch-repair endonuclease